MKILNLYGGLGGNRKKWPGRISVTMVDNNVQIADVYKRQFPRDTVIIADAHEYLRENYESFDFIWSSPPCQSHSRMIRSGRNRKSRYPDLKLYEEILFLKYNFKGKWVVENVIPYYKPLVKATTLGRHLFWSNFYIAPFTPPEFKNFINRQNLTAKKQLQDWLDIHYEENIYYGENHCPTQILRNCVHPDLGLHVYKCALEIDDLL